MKVLHTSDWHLGHLLYNESQEDAQKDMLEQITKIVEEEQPDAMIIAGDVYDTAQPSASVQQILSDNLMKMHRACEKMTIVCIAGNHDSGSKHMIFHTPWKALNVHMIGNIIKDSPLEDYIIPVPDKGFIVAVPFAANRFMPDQVYTALAELVEERNQKGLPVFLTAHLAIAKSDWKGHNFSSDDNIGGLNCQGLSVFGDGYDYIALGHIHKQQHLDKEKRVWYAGTPIAVSFDEVYAGNEHGVLMVECAKHGAPVKVSPIKVNNLHPLVNLPAEGAAYWDEVKEQLQKYDSNIASFIRLNVEIDKDHPAGTYDEAQMLIADKQCRLCLINSSRKEENTTNEGKKQEMSIEKLRKNDFVQLAEFYFKASGKEFDEEMRQMLNEVKIQLQQDND